MSKKSKKAQLKILNEIRDQLIRQAERWGKDGHYTPLKLEEMELEQGRKIRSDLLTEKSNLEYEMSMLGTDKKEVLIKIERLDSYIKKADRVILAHEKKIAKIIEKIIGDRSAIKKAENTVRTKHLISVMIDS